MKYRIKKVSVQERYYYQDGKDWEVRSYFWELLVANDRFHTWKEALDWTLHRLTNQTSR
jgi:hypothetical protein